MSKKIAKQDESADHLVVFQEKAIRRTWHGEEWWFSVVDVCGVLTDSPDAGAYWRKLKQRLGMEGGEVVTFCHGLKLEAPDAQGFADNRTAAKEGGTIAGDARKALEAKSGKRVLSKENYLAPSVAAVLEDANTAPSAAKGKAAARPKKAK